MYFASTTEAWESGVLLGYGADGTRKTVIAGRRRKVLKAAGSRPSPEPPSGRQPALVDAAPKGRGPKPATEHAIDELRAIVLRGSDGDFLGSEEQLAKWLNVSRPTLRQAVRVLEHDSLITVKRGVGGGFYVRRPTIDSVARAISVYLSLSRTTLDDAMSVTHALTMEAFQGACQAPDGPARRRLEDAVEALEAPTGAKIAVDELLAQEHALVDAVVELAGNNLIKLLVDMLRSLGVLALWDEQPQLRSAWRRERARLGRAILAGDQELTRSLALQSHQLITSGMRRTPGLSRNWSSEYVEVLRSEPPRDDSAAKRKA